MQTSWTLPRVSAALLLKLVSEVTVRGGLFRGGTYYAYKPKSGDQTEQSFPFKGKVRMGMG